MHDVHLRKLDFFRLGPHQHYRPDILLPRFHWNQESIEHRNQYHFHYDQGHVYFPTTTEVLVRLANRSVNNRHHHRIHLFYSDLQSNLCHLRRCNSMLVQVQHRIHPPCNPNTTPSFLGPKCAITRERCFMDKYGIF